MTLRKNTANNLTDGQEPVRSSSEARPRKRKGKGRRSRPAFPSSLIRRAAVQLRNLTQRLSRGTGAVQPRRNSNVSAVPRQSTEFASVAVPPVKPSVAEIETEAQPVAVQPALSAFPDSPLSPPNAVTDSAKNASKAASKAASNDATGGWSRGLANFGLVKLAQLLRQTLGRSLAQFLASLTFYTLLPIPFPQRYEFHRIARFAPWVGLLLGLGLGIADWGLGALGMNAGLRTAIMVVSWLGLTGGLHMDGAMDSADGLAVMDPKRRLAVMSDSVTGAFGVMAAMSLLLLKFAALMALPVDPVIRTVVLMAAMGWGRWGQVLAIDRYVYLKVEGKGAFHKRQLRSPEDLWPGLIALLGLSALLIWFFPDDYWMLAVGMVLGGFAIAFCTGAWFNRQLGGHTGDTYGAVVEWTEALLLCLLTLL